ncbi:MAG: hypothetical protein ABI234_10585 [Ktedonobacteraceae bacterium]
MNIPPVFWMGLLVVALLVIGVRSSRSARRYPPTWLCVLLVAAALYGMWVLLGVQFGHHLMRIG